MNRTIETRNNWKSQRTRKNCSHTSISGIWLLQMETNLKPYNKKK